MKSARLEARRGLSRALLSCAALIALACAMPASAKTGAILPTQPSAQQIAMYEQGGEGERVKLLIFLAKSGNGAQAQFLLQRYPLQGPFAENRTLFIRGLIEKSHRNYTGAAKLFRTALANDPKLTMVRAELAETLVTLGEDDSAKHHLELLASEAPSAETARGVRAFIDQVDQRRPYKASGYISIAPSTNINNGSRHETVYSPFFGADVEIGKPNQKSSGLGTAVGGNVAYTKRLGNDFSFVAAGNAEGRIYTDKDYNTYSLSQSVELRHLLENGYLGLGAVASQTLKNDALGVSYYSYGPRISLNYNLTQKDQFTASVVREWRDYVDSHGSDGYALLTDAAWTHAFDSSFNATLSGGFDRVKTNTPTTAYKAWSGGLSLYKELPQGITLNLSGEIRRSDFDGFSLLVGKTRQDTRLTGSIGLTKRDLNIMGFAPSVEYTYIDNLSNVSLFDYDAHAIDVRLTKDF